MEALTLYELNGLVRAALEGGLPDAYWLQAELSEVRVAYNGHCYLEFVQKASNGRDLLAKARGVIWAGAYRLLKLRFEQATGRQLAPGLKVLVQVEISFHELYGYSLTVTDIDSTYTLGDMARLRREILAQLETEGILNDNKELPLPLLTQRIAVISSSTAAGYGDFCNQLLHNDYHFRFVVRLFPAVMQGDRVESSVLSALDAIMAECGEWDAVVIIRGGGATSDLSAFDTYLLAAACAQFPLPVITGIGHERDDTVIDAVAHTRVKTPTAAAAFLINHLLETATDVEGKEQRILRAAGNRMESERQRMLRAAHKLSTVYLRVRAVGERRLDALMQQMGHAALQRLEGGEHRLQLCENRLRMKLPARLERERFRLQLLGQRCEAVDPVALLKRGYSMTFREGQLVRDARTLKSGEEITTRLAEGEVRSVIK
ncbi:MAG: exodeoxyribonuclease VII large subunit [Paraprevotella sp.]|nr:exodeoxyribonuclease VII large subunit [Paraprevotella sp.]